MNPRIRVLSCNLFSGRADAAALRAVIEQDGVDIVCVQELSPLLAKELSRPMPHGDLSEALRGNGIASRLPVEITRIRMPKRDGMVATLRPEHWEGLPLPIQVVNVHISGPHLWPYRPHPVRRGRQLAALLADRQAHADIPHAIVGDFNSSPVWPVYRRIAARYVDAVAAVTTAPRGTWPCIPALGIRGLLRIDHCFVHRLVARSARVIAIPGSDHLALCVDLEVPDAAGKSTRGPGDRSGRGACEAGSFRAGSA